jgi:photosystem II stability/assembly factor-like uncharacterized protein
VRLLAALLLVATASCTSVRSGRGSELPSPTLTLLPNVVSASPSASASKRRLFQPESIAFWSERAGLVAGAYGCYTSGCGGWTGEVFVTSDGSRTWLPVLRTGAPATFVSVLEPNDAWIAEGSRIEATSDRGRTWRLLPKAPVSDPVFVTDRLGWAARTGPHALGPRGLEQTMDGGRSWQTRPDPCFRAIGSVRALSFPKPSLGLVLCTGEPGAGQQQKGIFSSYDEGSTWHPVSISTWKEPPSTLGGYGYATGVQFLPDGRGWVVEYFRGCLLESSDAGQTWRCNPVTEPEVTAIASVSFVSDQDGFALFKKGWKWRLIATTDGGSRWQTSHLWPTR